MYIHRPTKGLCIRPLGFLVLIVALIASSDVRSQQPNTLAGTLYVQFRNGAPWPLVANAPNNGTLNTFAQGGQNAPWMILLGPLHPSYIISAGGQRLDVGTPPALADVALIGNGGGDPFVAGFMQTDGVGIQSVNWPIGTGFMGQLPGIQALMIDPTSPDGFIMTGASQITLKPSKSVMFLQGDYNPGPFPNCRLSDTSPFGFSSLKSLLLTAGFNSVTEVIDTQVTVDQTLVSGKDLVVLGSNQRALTSNEVLVLANVVRQGRGLLAYADAQFGPSNWSSDNSVLNQFGLGVANDNFGGLVSIGSFVPHPVTRGLDLGITAEGISLVQVAAPTAPFAITPTALAPCATNGGCFPIPATPPIPAVSPVYSAIAVGGSTFGGRVAVTCDRNTFLNAPGIGTSIDAANNLLYAINLFYWAAGY